MREVADALPGFEHLLNLAEVVAEIATLAFFI